MERVLRRRLQQTGRRQHCRITQRRKEQQRVPPAAQTQRGPHPRGRNNNKLVTAPHHQRTQAHRARGQRWDRCSCGMGCSREEVLGLADAVEVERAVLGNGGEVDVGEADAEGGVEVLQNGL